MDARTPADASEPEFGPVLTFEEAERGLGYPPGTLREAADKAGWTEMKTLNPVSLCDVLCLIWPQLDDDYV